MDWLSHIDPTGTMTPLRWLAVAALLAAAACADEGPVSGPGTMTATLVSPNGAEGAAQLVLDDPDIGTISPVGDTEVYVETHHRSTTVVLVNQVGGDLSFQVAVPDTTRPPTALVIQVAGPNDELRTGDYALRYSR